LAGINAARSVAHETQTQMSDSIQHECGIAYIRLRKPLEYYLEKYHTTLWGFNMLAALMHKQRNRGQDGVGIGCVKIDAPYGKRYMFHEKSIKRSGLSRIFDGNQHRFDELERQGIMDPNDPDSVKEHFDYGGENLVGHLRYTTFGGATSTFCHPQVRESNWATKSLMMLGNFTMTNTQELTQLMIERGQHPFHDTDTQVILEDIGFHLDEQHTDIYREYRDANMPGEDIPPIISEQLDIVSILQDCSKHWDGGYAMVGLIGNGDGFAVRDPGGIRPCFYVEDEEVIAFASERAPLMTVFDKEIEEVKELPPGHVASVKHSGEFIVKSFAEEKKVTPCSFERIYFSRGNDPDIYKERKALGAKLVPQVLDEVGKEWHNTVFSFIPNTAHTGYLGLMEGVREERRKDVLESIKQARDEGNLSNELLESLILENWPRGEKVANKDEQFRTFISNEKGRKEMVSIAYDITYGVVEPKDTLVALDDSIVRGTTLKQAILKILTRGNPKKIVITSTAPQIRYPDCYGIDMSELGKFLAFQAAIQLIEARGMGKLREKVKEACEKELKKHPSEQVNCVKAIYEPFSPEEIATQMAKIVYPKDVPWKGELVLIFQTIENLHDAIPDHSGDWYFTGNYPTPGGYAVVNQAYVNFQKGLEGRPYDAQAKS